MGMVYRGGTGVPPSILRVYIQLCKTNEITVSAKVALKHHLVGQERDEQDFAIRPYS